MKSIKEILGGIKKVSLDIIGCIEHYLSKTKNFCLSLPSHVIPHSSKSTNTTSNDTVTPTVFNAPNTATQTSVKQIIK